MSNWTLNSGVGISAWTPNTISPTVFSLAIYNNKDVFSRASFGGKKVFSLGNSTWTIGAAPPASSWVANGNN